MQDAGSDFSSVMYTLKNYDHRGYKSLQRLYLEIADPTEWKFANTYLDGWDHWTKMLESNWFRVHITEWRRQLEIKLKSAAVAQIIKISNDPSNKAQMTALKEITSGGWWDTGEKRKGAGRPSKAEREAFLKEEAEKHSQILEEAVRLGLQ